MLTYDTFENQQEQDSDRSWFATENDFNPYALGKGEVLFCQGNGYLGIRAALEETYAGSTRNAFIAGTYNRFDEHEVTELPNCPDVFGLNLLLNGKPLDLSRVAPLSYKRSFNAKNGELVRSFIWDTEETGKVEFVFKRFVSLENLHLVAQKVTLRPLEKPIYLVYKSGINGQTTNSGVQHFSEMNKRIRSSKVLQMTVKTTESNIGIVVNAVQRSLINGEIVNNCTIPIMDRRILEERGTLTLAVGSEWTFEKIASYYSTRDLACSTPADDNINGNQASKALDGRYSDASISALEEITANELLHLSLKNYSALLLESNAKWEHKVWDMCDIIIKSDTPSIQTILRMARYHMTAMAPVHDNRMSIAAKGLTGEGYKGHVFWDTEIFLLPAFTFTKPNEARSMLEYRYKTLNSARRKALENGYKGAMFPWESAWIEDGEVTPVWGAADIITGLPTKIWSGFIEQHITADVSFAVWQYHMATGDDDFMNRYGYEIIFSTADFWASRMEYDNDLKKMVIRNVVGPDEYKEHVDNNTFTNALARWTLNTAASYGAELSKRDVVLYEALDQAGFLCEGLDSSLETWKKRAAALLVHEPDDTGLIPQDDTYLTKRSIDLAPYKNGPRRGKLFEDYNLTQVNDIQVSKQADVVLLMYLLEDQYTPAVKERCFKYYENRTLHDSSLSLSTHCILACDLGMMDLSKELFKRSLSIDFGPDSHSSDHGIHAASVGGLWQSVVCGYGGLRVVNGNLRINPRLPLGWNELTYNVMWKGEKISIHIDREHIEIVRSDAETKKIIATVSGKELELAGRTLVNL